MDPQEIDDIDRRIIDQLRIDGRRSFGEVGRAIGLSEAAVRGRFHRLRRRGVLQVVGMADAQRVGELEVHLAIRVRSVPVANVARQLTAMPELRFVASAVGPYDVFCDVRCRDLAHLSELVTERIRRINGIEGCEVLTVLEVLKDDYLWTGFRDAAPKAR